MGCGQSPPHLGTLQLLEPWSPGPKGAQEHFLRCALRGVKGCEVKDGFKSGAESLVAQCMVTLGETAASQTW